VGRHNIITVDRNECAMKLPVRDCWALLFDAISVFDSLCYMKQSNQYWRTTSQEIFQLQKKSKTINYIHLFRLWFSWRSNRIITYSRRFETNSRVLVGHDLRVKSRQSNNRLRNRVISYSFHSRTRRRETSKSKNADRKSENIVWQQTR